MDAKEWVEKAAEKVGVGGQRGLPWAQQLQSGLGWTGVRWFFLLQDTGQALPHSLLCPSSTTPFSPGRITGQDPGEQ